VAVVIPSRASQRQDLRLLSVWQENIFYKKCFRFRVAQYPHCMMQAGKKEWVEEGI